MINDLLGAHGVPRRLGRLYNAGGGFVRFPDRETVLAPDVAFVRAERMPQGEARRHFPRLAPDLAIEVTSPSDRRRDIVAKVAMSQAAGVPLVWLVDPPAQTVTVFALGQEPVMSGGGNDFEGGVVAPGFRVAVAEIFA